MMIHNIAYDKRILPDERVRLVVAACYLVLGYTSCRPAEIVDDEKKQPNNPRYNKLFESRNLLQLNATSDPGFKDDSRVSLLSVVMLCAMGTSPFSFAVILTLGSIV